MYEQSGTDHDQEGKQCAETIGRCFVAEHFTEPDFGGELRGGERAFLEAVLAQNLRFVLLEIFEKFGQFNEFVIQPVDDIDRQKAKGDGGNQP